jgi:hypothetical protein
MPGTASAYTPENHERYVNEGAKMCERDHNITISNKDLTSMIQGVREPDEISLAHLENHLQMFMQRIEPDSPSEQQVVVTTSIAVQSIHGSPNPTRPPYTDSANDQMNLRKIVRTPPTELMPNRLELDVYSYDTNQQVRNKILINASQFLCVSYAHKDDAQSARKFGNLLHMIGDTYSASHVQRSAPQGSIDNCGTEKIEWHYSMDLISWKLHIPADQAYKDWRFRCLVKHTANLMKLWVSGRKAVSRETNKLAKLKRANEKVKETMKLLCNSMLREDADILRRPSGGAPAGYSIASGSDNWKFFEKIFEKQDEDKPIQPVGLTGPEEAETFYEKVSAKLREEGSPIQFFYPPRNMSDLCKGIDGPKPLPAPLQCTSPEIDWAMLGSDAVKSMWIPARTQP